MTDAVNRVPAFGFETKNLRAGKAEARLKYNYNVENVLKVAGYIPVLGTAAGVFRLIRLKKLEANDAKHVSVTNAIIRGIIETTSLGVVLLPFDLGVTSGRKIMQLMNSSKKVNNNTDQ